MGSRRRGAFLTLDPYWSSSLEMQKRWRSVRGYLLFKDALSKEGAPAQRELAAQLGVGENTVYFWKVGFRRPRSEIRDAIERILGVPADSWLTATELGKAKRLRAASAAA